ncbi:MAG: RNA-binding protein [Polyangiaceae bacterium]|nr:RNA-binding protein [Polyangiaceae bacterium]
MQTDDARKLFVAGLPDSVDEEVLRQVFEATGGTVVQVSVPRDRATGRPRGFGFVTLSSAEEATRARETLDGSTQAGRSISVRPFSSDSRRGPGDAGGDTRPRPEPRAYQAAGAPASGGAPAGGGQGGDDRSIYIGNLPYDADRPGLESVLKERGVNQVVRVHMPTGPDGRARGFAFVSLASPEAVNEALVQLRNLELGGRRLMINAAHARGERPERTERPGGGGYAPRPGGPPNAGGGGFERPSTERRPSIGDFGAAAPQQRSSFDNRDFEGRREGKKKKVEAAKKKQPAAPDDRRRGGGNNWRTGLDSDDWSDD